MHAPFSVLALLASVAVSVSGHGVITAVSGANGVNGQGFAVIDGTPRDTARPSRLTQVDTSIIRDDEIEDGEVSGCGRTRGGGPVDVATELQSASANGLPAAAADGSVTMTLHQINGDGAGPYTCDVSADGTATSFVSMQVTQQVPGNNGRSRNDATDFPLVAQMPAGTQCTGGPNGDACIVRCRNPARAGPFGSCVAVTNSNAGNATAAAGTGSNAAAAADGTAAGSNGNAAANTGNANTGTANAGTANTGATNKGASNTSTGTANSGTANASTANNGASNTGNLGSAAVEAAEAQEEAEDEEDGEEEDQATGNANTGNANGAGVASSSSNFATGAGATSSQRQRGAQKRYISSRILGRRTPAAWI